MKIAIITWFENLNFGTALQAYALQKYLKDSFGADVSLINYSPNKKDQLHSIKQKTHRLAYRAFKKIKSCFYDEYKRYDKLMETTYFEEKVKRESLFNSFLAENIAFTERVKSREDLNGLNNEFDLFICGSDQIWNPINLNGVYFLDFVKEKIKLSYAASFGMNYIPKYADDYIREYLKDFKGISIREGTCKNELEKITDKKVSVVCDPTFLISPESWEKLQSQNSFDKKYFVTYFLGDTKFNRKAIKSAESKFHLSNLIIPNTEYAVNISKKENIALGPKDFISAIYNSEFVLTDSFHAVCFSIMFKKNFCVLEKQKGYNPFRQNSRIESLLNILGISERFVKNSSRLEKAMSTPIDYNAVYKRLDKYIEASKCYLGECIKID